MASFTPLVLCIVLTATLAGAHWRSSPRIMTVTVPSPEVTANAGSDAKLPCTYSIPDAASGLKPTINWYKGDAGISTATKIFSLSYQGATQVPESYGDYTGRVTLENPAEATLTLRGVTVADNGRYWCAVFDSDQHDQLGMDSKSVLLTVIDPNVQQDQGAAGRPGHVELRVPAQRQVYEGDEVELTCECDDCHWSSIKSWFTVSFDNTWAATEELIATETGCGSHQCPGESGTVAPAFQGHFSVTSGGLKIAATRREDKRRYWCQVEDPTYTARGSGVDAQSVALAVESRCTGKPAGVYQHPDDCSKFFTCAEGGLQYDGINTCPGGLHFDETLGFCNWATLVTCL